MDDGAGAGAGEYGIDFIGWDGGVGKKRKITIKKKMKRKSKRKIKTGGGGNQGMVK